MAVRKEVFEKIGGFAVGFPIAEDMLFLAQLYGSCHIALSPAHTFSYLADIPNNRRTPLETTRGLSRHFDALLATAAHRSGVRTYVAAWHRRLMASAILLRRPRIAWEEFLRCWTIRPLQTKVFTSAVFHAFKAFSQP